MIRLSFMGLLAAAGLLTATPASARPTLVARRSVRKNVSRRITLAGDYVEALPHRLCKTNSEENLSGAHQNKEIHIADFAYRARKHIFQTDYGISELVGRAVIIPS
jgi:hypothetical protein